MQFSLRKQHVILSGVKNPCNPEPKNEVIGPENRFGWLHFEGFFTPLRSVQNDMSLKK